ncbi:MAG TPA: hypothetical protein VJ989_08895 [Solirubrobacterales bacterium]|nr:hypothetical protein [Solirubrobacterales bacterium]
MILIFWRPKSHGHHLLLADDQNPLLDRGSRDQLNRCLFCVEPAI